MVSRTEALANPGASNAKIQAALEEAKPDLPVVAFPPDDYVELPGGLTRKDEVIRGVVVRELNGEDEEALARAVQTPNPFHFLNTLLDCGVVSIGDVQDVAKALKDLLVGDRDEAILGIRKATYGDDVEVFGWVCPSCSEEVSRISFSLTEDIHRVKLGNPLTDSVFEVPLRKGGSARVRLANGHDQTATFDDPKLLGPQRDDILLSRCILTLTDKDGTEHSIAGFPSMVRKLSIPDRRAILKELSDRQPGPRYNEIKFRHDGCGDEVTLALGIRDLFRELLPYL